MNLKHFKTVIFLVSFFFVSVTLFAETPNNYKIKLMNGSRIWVEGDSTFHAYKSVSTAINLNTDIDFKSASMQSYGLASAMLAKKSYTPQFSKLILEMAVKKFHSDVLGLDGNFNETLKYKECPAITFTLSKYTIEEDKNVNNRFYIMTDGILKIAGKEKPVSLYNIAEVKGNTVILTGKKDLLMTDFMITPPKLLFITTEDKVTVKWELELTVTPVEAVSLANKI